MRGIEYSCPECDEEISVPETVESIVCQHCKASLDINWDAERIDGRWIDKTTIRKKKMIKTTLYPLVQNFHTTFNVRRYEMLSFVPAEVLKARADFMAEEEAEYNEASDSVARLDAVCDLLYFNLGTSDICSLPLVAHESLVEGSLSDLVSNVFDELIAPIPCQKVLPTHLANLNARLAEICNYENWNLEGAFKEVHATNMRKLWTKEEVSITLPTDYKVEPVLSLSRFVVRNKQGKIMKPHGWRGPELARFIDNYRPYSSVNYKD